MANVIDNYNDINSSELLCQAAINGDTNFLQELLKRDPLILQRPPPPPPSSSSTSNFTTSVGVFPLNLACKYGHKEFVSKLLRWQPDLFMDAYDQALTPLHIACRNGHHEVVEYLVSVNPAACFLRDNQGWNPVHVAAARGHCKVLNELVKACPHSVRERTVCPTASGGLGDTALHVCVKHNQLEALKLLVNKVGDKRMMNAGDANGNTILHIAVTHADQPEVKEMVEFLTNNKNTDINKLNADGLTPMDVYSEQDDKDVRLKSLLKRVNSLRSVDIPNDKLTSLDSWVENKRNTLMVVASLICTMAFQAGINPPGGVWQDSTTPPTDDFGTLPHTAGHSILASNNLHLYRCFITFNTIGLVSSTLCICILIMGQPIKKVIVMVTFRKVISVIIMVTMWIALAFMMSAYFVSLVALTPEENSKFISQPFFPLYLVAFVLTAIILLIILAHFIPVIVQLVKRIHRPVRSWLYLMERDQQTVPLGAP